MGINIRQKGQTGEREVAQALNTIVLRQLERAGLPLPPADKPPVQRNQNQSAVGGADLTGTYGLAIEVKRQESLSVNTWWQQCTTQARNNGEVPVLVYRQNGKKWHVVMLGELPLPAGAGEQALMRVRSEIDWETFLQFFETWVRRKLELREISWPPPFAA